MDFNTEETDKHYAHKNSSTETNTMFYVEFI